MRLKFGEVTSVLERVLLARHCKPEFAERVAFEMARNSLEGTYTHGINRFRSLIGSIDSCLINVGATPILRNQAAALESYDGQLGLGITNALFSMDRAISLARSYGVGIVALANTSHWMRAATYGYQACQADMIGICFTNTIPNMPTWGAIDSRLGNNPLVLAFPRSQGDVVVDMAMSQFSYGALELARLEGRAMSMDAGYNEDGELTRDPEQVLRSQRILPAGYWKGAALSFVLDLIVTGLSQGNSVFNLGQQPGGEYGVAQVFIAIDLWKIADRDYVEEAVNAAVEYLLNSEPATNGERIVYPGQRMEEIRDDNLRNGIPVDPRVWDKILGMLD